MNPKSTFGFGVPQDYVLHHFYVEIPESPHEPISIYEDYGLIDKDSSIIKEEKEQCRVKLIREMWHKIRDHIRKDFNARLKSQKQHLGNWIIGNNKIDRFLGREICVLAWAIEHANEDECPIICQKWLALRPEERWWLYSKTAAEADGYEDKDRGWRKAIYCALSDGMNIKLFEKEKKQGSRKTNKLTIKDTEQISFLDESDHE